MLKKFMIAISLLIVFLFLFSPSISAIQLNTIENSFVREFNEKKIDLNQFDIINIEQIPDHPILYYIIYIIYLYRLISAYSLFDKSIGFENVGEIPQMYIKHPLLFILAIALMFRADMWDIMWSSIASKMGWNW